MKIWIVIIAAGILTYLMRYLPMNSPFFQRMKILKHPAFAILPLCLLAALIGPNFLSVENENGFSIALFVGGLITVVLCRKSKSIFTAALAGYLSFIFLDYVLKLF